MRNVPASLDTPTPIVVFGLDDQGKGHASRFEPTDAPLAERAAGLMGMRVLRLTTPEAAALAAELPAGRVFASGKAFVPFVAKSRFDRLAAAPGVFVPDRPADVPPLAPAGRKGGRSAMASTDTAGEAGSGAEGAGTPARDWPGIGVGGLVLAAEEGLPSTWYAATVVADRGEDLFELRWVDDGGEDLPTIVRRREHLGLFPAAVAGELA